MENAIEVKSFAFAVRIVKLCKYLRTEKHESVLSKQILRSGTSIGANIAEAQHAQSKADFVSKMHIALKETGETKYWLRLLYAADYCTEKAFSSVFADCVELEKLLVSILKTANLQTEL